MIHQYRTIMRLDNVDCMSMQIIATLVIIIAVLMCGCNKQPRNPAKTAKPPEQRLQVATREIVVKWLVPGSPSRQVWSAKAKTGVGLQGESLTGGTSGRFEGVDCTLFDKDGKAANRLQAASVIADRDKNEIKASGGIKATSLVNKVTLSADRATWNTIKHQIIAEGSVRLSGEGFDVRGERMVLNTALTSMHLTNP